MKSMDKQSNKARFKQCSYFFSSDQVSIALSQLTITASQCFLGLLDGYQEVFASESTIVGNTPTSSRLQL